MINVHPIQLSGLSTLYECFSSIFRIASINFLSWSSGFSFAPLFDGYEQGSKYSAGFLHMKALTEADILSFLRCSPALADHQAFRPAHGSPEQSLALEEARITPLLPGSASQDK
jgi:hypothetical protein